MLREAMANIADPSRIVRLSGLDIRALTYLYQNADVFVMPSLYEGFGLPVLEAMMAGAPVVSSGKASLPELGGETVDTFDPDTPGDLADTLRAVLARSPEERAIRILAARERARTFTWKLTANKTLAALRNWAGKGMAEY